jgi:hypothetical protein
MIYNPPQRPSPNEAPQTLDQNYDPQHFKSRLFLLAYIKLYIVRGFIMTLPYMHRMSLDYSHTLNYHFLSPLSSLPSLLSLPFHLPFTFRTLVVLNKLLYNLSSLLLC